MANRIDALASLVPKNSIVADIGTDHAYLIINLLLTKKIRYAYAIDNKTGPINNAIYNIKKNNLSDKCKIIKADGLDFKVTKDINVLVLAGLGGSNIVQIIDKGKSKLKYIKYIVTDAHRDNEKVQEYLLNLGFKINQSIDIIDKKKKYHLVQYANK
ncbi:MAG: class I SAM-dependent methyltransferase [Bacilli bacterium]|nr:class I SAM-dependent methyltransferase [Bacilli bacterium]